MDHRTTVKMEGPEDENDPCRGTSSSVRHVVVLEGSNKEVPIKEEEPEDDNYLYCEECKCFYTSECEVHGPPLFICDAPVPTGGNDRARQSLPSGLEVRRSSIPDAGLGVFNKGEAIPVGAHFGPYQGDLVDKEEAMDSVYSWAIYKGRRCEEYIDAKSDLHANWMRYVNCSRNGEENNLVAFQYQGGILYRCCQPIKPGQELLVWYDEEYAKHLSLTFDYIWEKKSSNERCSLSQAMKLLGLLDGENSELEDLSDIDDPVGDAEYQPPRQEPSSSEEDSSGCEDLIPQPSKPVRGRKRHRDECEGYPSDCDSTSSRTPRRCSRTQQDDADVSNNIPEDITPEPSNRKQTKKGCGMRWRANPLIPKLKHELKLEDETEQDREGWTPSDYMEQYIDKDLMKKIANCSNATSLARGGALLNTSTDEIYHFFGACILMSCIPYPAIRMYWSRALRFDAITQKFTRDRFFRLRRSLKVLLDEDVPQDIRECDKFWKVRPFLNRILKGCKSQARPQCVSIDEQMIPFTGACPCRQYLPMKPNPVGMKKFVCATADGIVLDFHIYQGAGILLEQVEEPEGLGLGGLVIDCLSQTLHPNTNVYCDRFFTTIQIVERMMNKQIYVTGKVMKNRIASAVQKLPDNKSMKKNGRGTSAQVTTEDGKVCVVKWYDNKPVLMMSTVHEREPEDTCQRWDKKLKRYVTIPRPSIVREYNSNMGGVDLVDRMMSYYHLSGRTKKWTLRMLMHFTDLALANSWLLYRKDHTVRRTPKKNILQFLEFRMDVAITFLSQLGNDNSELSQQEDNKDDLVHGKKRSVKGVPHVSVRRRGNAHMPEVVNMKNSARCRVKGCTGKTRVKCVRCNVFLCLQPDRNCYTAFHT